MIEFFKNLFRRKEKIKMPKISKIEHFVEDDDIHIYVDKKKRTIRIEAPSELTQEEIMEIAERYYKNVF